MIGNRLKILMVDDDDVDIFTMRRAFHQHDSKVDFTGIGDGESLEAYLDDVLNCDTYKARSTQILILLDINMPIRSGIEILVALRANERFKFLPIIILSTSGSETDIKKCYGLGANSFATKPSSLEETHRLAASVCTYWTQSITLPTLANA